MKTARSRGWTRGPWGQVALVGLVLGCASGPEQVDSPAADQARALMRSTRARPGNLLLRCEPLDAEVYLDGVLQGVCTDFGGGPSGLQVGVGLHRIDVKKDGYWSYTTYYEPGSARAGLTIRLRPVEQERGGANRAEEARFRYTLTPTLSQERREGACLERSSPSDATREARRAR